MRSLTTLVLLSAAAAAFAAAPPARAPAEWHKLIEQLGDDDADVRQAAEKKLLALGEDVLPVLREASRTQPDVDARLRAGVLAAAIQKTLFGEIHCMEGHAWW